MINLSIIIPHKNTSDLLQRCINSIPRREDIQIIIADDNSDPDKVDFENFPGLNDPFVEVIFDKNEYGRKGAGYARNLGLERAKGKWLLFADADDFFTEDAFDCIFSEKDSPHEVIYFKTMRLISGAYFPYTANNRINKTGVEDCIRYNSNPPWGKMINRELVVRNNIRFEETSSGNDVMFSVLTGHFAKSVNTVAKTIYVYTSNKGSISHTMNLEKMTARYISCLRINKFLREAGKKQYQRSIMIYLFRSRKYGIKTFFYFLRLAIQYKNNPFIGISHWLSNYQTLYRSRK